MATDYSIEEDSQPPGINNIYSSFFNPKKIIPIENRENLFRFNHHNLTVRIETDLQTCHHLFEKFSPKKTLFELWSFRYAFYLGYHYQPVFLIFERGNEPVGLLPLWYESDKDELRWFGSWWQEGNTFWFRDQSIIPTVLSLFRQKILLNALCLDPSIAKKFGLITDDPKYLLSLEEYPSVESFLNKFNGKKRYNLRRDQRLILNKNPKTIINRFEDIDFLFKLSIKRYLHKKDDQSAFVIKERRETFRQIINQAKEYKTRIISTEIGGKVVGVDLVAIYKGVYYSLNGAYNLQKHPGLGNYTNLVLIQDAINLGMKTLDFLEVSYGWKEEWFEPVPLFQFKGTKEK